MIYFDVETKKRILLGLEEALNPQGFLLLGGAETTLNLSESLDRRSIVPGSSRLVGPRSSA